MAAGSEPAKKVVLVHLSDLHFVEGHVGSAHDRDTDLRNELEHDARDICRKLGGATAVVVTGDVAFAARPAEYEFATDWLFRLGDGLGCQRDRIWVIPGNHDVSWGSINADQMISIIQESLRKTDTEELDRRLESYMKNDDISSRLFQPLGSYRAFAAEFGCYFDRQRPYWEKDLVLNDGTLLRFRGLTSVFVSMANRPDRKGEMVLGLACATLPRSDGVEYVVLCHHPVDWFREAKSLDRHLMNRARIVLFGHNHEQDLERREESVFLVAGALHPQRDDTLWQPRYNVITISVGSRGDVRELQIEVYPRIWSEGSLRFESEQYKGASSRKYGFEMEPSPQSISPEIPGALQELVELRGRSEDQVIMRTVLEVMEPPGPATPDQPNIDQALVLAQAFWDLPYHVRVRIVRALSLLEEHERRLPEEARVVLTFRRARERRLLEQLRSLVEEAGRHR